MAYRIDDHDLLSAIWVMASNDENPIITYAGIQYRLDLPPHCNVEELVNSRPELFRHGVNETRLNEWKGEMITGKHRPSWIRVKGEEEAQRQVIQALTVNDVFRSQFRTKHDATQSDIDTIKLGLEHLDRLRKGELEARDANVKSRQLWLVFGVGVLGIVTQILIKWLWPGN